MRIASRLDRLVTHQFSHCAKFDAGHHQAARKCVPQAVPSEEADARLANCRVKPVLVALQRLPLHINKTSPLPTGAREQILKCRQRDRVQRNVPGVPILALRDRNDNLGKTDYSASQLLGRLLPF